MRFLGKSLLAGLLVLGIAGCALAVEPIRIGYLATLTGDGSTWGQHERDGAMMAVRAINESGGLLGGRPVELIYYDVRGRPEDAVVAIRRLIHSDRVVAIGGSNFSSIQLAIGPVAEAAQIPVISSSATNPAVTVDPNTGNVRPFMFRIAYTDAYQGTVIADYLINRLGATRLAVIGNIGDPFSEGLTEFVRNRADELGVENRFWGFRSGDVDFRAQITEARAWGADAVALTMLYMEMGLVIRQAAELGWTPFFMGGDGYSPNMFNIAGDAMEGTYWLFPMSREDIRIHGFLERFQNEYGREATEFLNAVFAYDIMQMLFQAIETAGKAEGPAIRDAIANTRDFEVTHFTWSVCPETHNPLNKPGAILRATDGRVVYVETWSPQIEF